MFITFCKEGVSFTPMQSLDINFFKYSKVLINVLTFNEYFQST